MSENEYLLRKPEYWAKYLGGGRALVFEGLKNDRPRAGRMLADYLGLLDFEAAWLGRIATGEIEVTDISVEEAAEILEIWRSSQADFESWYDRNNGVRTVFASNSTSGATVKARVLDNRRVGQNLHKITWRPHARSFYASERR